MTTETVSGSLQQQVCKWSNFERYSSFEAFDALIRKELPFQMKDVKLPSKKRFGSKTPEFIELRRGALQDYLRDVLQIARVVEFDTHFGSKALSGFLRYNQRFNGMQGVASTESADVNNPTATTQTTAASQHAAAGAGARRRGYRKRGGGSSSRSSAASTTGGAPPSAISAGIVSHAPSQASSVPASVVSAPAPAPAPAAAAVAAKVIPKDAPPAPPGRNSLLASIQQGKKLKKAKTVVKGR
jgi:hypothetical protein